MIVDPITPDLAKTLPHSGQDQLYALLKEPLQRVEDEIQSNAKSDVTKVSAITEYVVSAGGKRIRPLLTLASACLCGEIHEATYKLACAVEYIHTSTLLHDDVLDESDLRRGKLASHKVWGNTNSVLVGDFLFARAFELMVETNSIEILKILSKSSSVIVEGEIRQLDSIAGQKTIARDDYYATIDAKTAELFKAACLTGAISGGNDNPQDLHAIAEFGLNLGRAFQIIDDILDYTGDSHALGKQVGDDFREQKLTLPLIIAQECCDQNTVDYLSTLMGSDTVKASEFTDLTRRLTEAGVFEKARAEATYFAEQAAISVDHFRSNSLVLPLKALVKQGLTRLS